VLRDFPGRSVHQVSGDARNISTNKICDVLPCHPKLVGDALLSPADVAEQ
jgi:hypothetical protein